ncbi:MAG: site-2 protease family protein [Actinobacteria bacterium]|nr:site-2 protease family protein [Actinomycetota bacterium]
MLERNIKLFKIFGIEVGLNWSWFLIFILVIFSLSTQVFPGWYPQFSLITNLILGFITAIFFFASILTHELSHSVVANLSGISIRKINLFIFGGVAQMSKPPQTAVQEFLMAIAGPLASFVLSIFFGIFWFGLQLTNFKFLPVIAFFGYLSLINLSLGIFNLLPGFPLDGGRILRSILWYLTEDLLSSTRIASILGQIIGYSMAAFGFMSIFIYQLQSFGGLWFVVLGLFLQNLAKTSYKQEIIRSSLETVFVRDVMRRDVQTINPDITINDLVKNWFMIYGHKIFPVLENGEIIGTVSTEDVKIIPKDRWLTTTVREVLKTIKESQLINLESKVMDALHKMNGNQLDYLLIVEQNRLLGIIHIDDIMRYVKLKRDFKI